MNNIQKAFKAKAQLGLRMATGGLIDQPDLISQGNSLMDSIRSDSSLRQRQRVEGLGAVGGQLANLGVKPVDPTFGLSGLKGRHRMQAQVQNFNNAITAAKVAQPTAPDTGGLGSIGGAPVLQDKKPALADGGVVTPKETPDQLMARMAAKYGAPAAGRPAPAPAPVAPAPTPAPVPQKPAFGEGLRRAMDPRTREQALGLAGGGIVRGPGGPTDDAVPMRVNGKDVNLSNTEAVLPAKTVAALGGPEAVEELIEKTNGKPPSKAGLRAGGDYADGMVAQTRPWYAGTDTSDDRTGLELERARRAQGPTIKGDPLKQVLMTGTLGDGKSQPATSLIAAPAAAPTTPAAVPAGPIGTELTPGTTMLKNGAPDMSVAGTHKFADPSGGVFDAYSKAGNNAVRLSSGKTALVGANDDGQAARDAQFAAEGRQKDAFGNWSHVTEGLKKQLSDVQRQRAEFDAFDNSITDPEARTNGLRRVAEMDARDAKSADLGLKAAEAKLKIADYNLRAKGQDNMQKNSERDFADKRNNERTTRIAKVLDMHAQLPDGKGIDPTMRADLERAFDAAVGGKMNNLSDGDFERSLPEAVNQARLSSNVQQAMRKAGVWNKYITNFGKKANTTLNAAEMQYDPQSDTLDVGGYKLNGKDVWGDDADLMELAKTTRQKKSN